LQLALTLGLKQAKNRGAGEFLARREKPGVAWTNEG
jgi:hypothetical protein